MRYYPLDYVLESRIEAASNKLAAGRLDTGRTAQEIRRPRRGQELLTAQSRKDSVPLYSGGRSCAQGRASSIALPIRSASASS
jgi:hypothetical protein